MISTKDFEVYKTIQKNKRLTEIYLGAIPFSWPFAIVEYKADCTEAIPFNLFDKVICGLLKVDGVLSFHEIASILGLNVIDNPSLNKYKDIAENEILIEALTSLFDFGMIEKGDSYFSKCKLTDIGKEYALKNLKFKTTENKSFRLYFDLFSNDHSKAKSVFQDFKATSIQEVDCDIDFEDESMLKSFAEFQIPEIFSVDKGNSFANSTIQSSSYYALVLDAGIVYDFQNDSFRVIFYNSQSKSNYFSDQLSFNEDIKSLIVGRYFSNLTTTDLHKSEMQLIFEERTCEIQNDVDYQLFQNKVDEVIVKLNSFYGQNEYLESVSFWCNFEKLLSTDVKEVFLFLPEINQHIIQILLETIPKHHEIIFLITYSTLKIVSKGQDESLIDYAKTENNIFLLAVSEEITFNSIFINIKNSEEFILSDFIIDFDSVLYSNKLIQKVKGTDSTERKCIEIKRLFSEKIVPKMIEQCVIELAELSLDYSKLTISRIQNIDLKLKFFEAFIIRKGNEHIEISDNSERNELLSNNDSEKVKYLGLQALKKEKLDIYVTNHQNLLMEKIKTLSESAKFDKIENVEQLAKLNKDLSGIEVECLPDYSIIKNEIDQLKYTLADIEVFIKDQLLAKHFIIDTNVFVDDPDILSKIDHKHQIILSAKVVDELDNLKRKIKDVDVKFNVDQALKLINKALGKQKNLKTARANLRLLPADFNDRSPDNFILSVAIMYKDKNPFLLTSDNGLQAKAKIIDIPTLSLKDYINNEKYKKISISSTLPKNQKTNKSISLTDLIKAYNSSLNPSTKKVMLSTYNESLIKNIKGFSYRDYGFEKFKDFCYSLSEVFEISFDTKGNVFLILKLNT